MTKKQIYEYLNYQGIYDNNVKRRLKKLIKKYHPDLNNGDDTTMKLINEVKKEIESNDSKCIKEQKAKKNKQSNSFFSINIISIIKKLNKEVITLNKKLQMGYHDEYELLKEYNDTKRLYNTLMLNKKVLEKQITGLKKINTIDKLNIFLILIFSLFLFIEPVLIIGLIAMLFVEIFYIVTRINKLKNKNKEVGKIDNVVSIYEKMSFNIRTKIDNLNKDIFAIKKSQNKVKQTIRYYEQIMSEDESRKESYKQK